MSSRIDSLVNAGTSREIADLAQFATASIAHEVNQPLSGIVTNAAAVLRMLTADPPNLDGAREAARRAIRDGNRASEVISRLRALFANEDASTEPLDLNDAAREAIAAFDNDLRNSQVALACEFAGDLPPVRGDRVQLQQVILNLLRNAVDAMRSVHDRTRQLVVRTARDKHCVRLSVEDAGTGFNPETSERLFELFHSTKREGMGVGLSISRSIVETHHGRLWATLNDRYGATFSFSIPSGLDDTESRPCCLPTAQAA